MRDFSQIKLNLIKLKIGIKPNLADYHVDFGSKYVLYFFALSQNIGEPLTGKKNTIILYPLSQKELFSHYNKNELKEKINILNELVDSYLLKDILSHEKIKSPKALMQILKLLSFQVGKKVSINEISAQVHLDVKTVSRYFDLLEKCFVIKPFSTFSSNLRKEVSTKKKFFFFDNGVRNALISQFAKPNERNDTGQLFENFIIMERIKKLSFKSYYGNLFFWRNYNGQEIDLVEQIDGKLHAFEIK